VLGDAAKLPFQDETFDVYTVRAAPHHFHDVDAFLQEAFRVLKPDRDAAFIDCAPPAAAREVLHEVEVRRDPSHVRSLTVDEWVHRLERAGFEVELASARELDWDYEEWMHTMAVEPVGSALAALDHCPICFSGFLLSNSSLPDAPAHPRLLQFPEIDLTFNPVSDRVSQPRHAAFLSRAPPAA